MLTYYILNCGNFCWILKTTKLTSFDKLILFYIHRRIQRGGGAKEVVPSRSNLFFQFHAVFRENGKISRLMHRDRKLVHPPGNHGSTTMSLFPLKPIMSCVCVLRPVSVFCVLRMLGTNTMLGAMDNMEFINVLSLNTIFVILQVR